MPSPFFSIIIPTRQRHQTLGYSIRTVLDQIYPDFELVVVDNKSSKETEDVVKSFDDSRVKYFYSEDRLTMSENWEKGLSHAEGQYIFFMGDDDAILPDGLSIAHMILSEYNTQVLAWNRDDCIYWWKDSILEFKRNLLSISVKEPRLSICDSIEMLQSAYCFRIEYQMLPMIYSAFIHRDLLLEIMLIYGKYFCHPIPDVFSGIVNAYFTESYYHSSRPLSMTGVSGNSTGLSFSHPHLSNQAMKNFLNELDKRGDAWENHHKLIPGSKQSRLTIADVFLKTKDLFFQVDDRIQFDMLAFILTLPDYMGMNLDTFDQEVELVLELARRNGIAETDIKLPRPKFHPPNQSVGFFFSEGKAIRIVVDCNDLLVDDIHHASKVAYSMLNRA